MYAPSIKPVDRYRPIAHSIPWKTWVKRWNAARVSSDIPAYLGVIYSASKTISGPHYSRTVFIAEEERWMRFLLEIADDYSAGNMVNLTIRDPGKEIAEAAFTKVMRTLKHFTDKSMEDMTNEFVDCLFWFFRPASDNPEALHHASLLDEMPRSVRDDAEKFIDAFAVWAWLLRPQEKRSNKLYRGEAIRLLAARGQLQKFMTEPLRQTWRNFSDNNCMVLRTIATRGVMTIREALRQSNRAEAAALYVIIRTACGQPWEN